MDFLLIESKVIVDIPDDDPSKLSEARDEESTKQPHKPKKEPHNVASPLRRTSSGSFQMISPKLLLLQLCF